MTQEPVNRLIDLAEKIGGEGWPLLVQGTFNNSLVGVIGASLFSLFFISLSALLFRKWGQLAKEDTYRAEEAVPVCVGALIGALIGAALTTMTGLAYIPGILCPACEAAVQVLGSCG